MGKDRTLEIIKTEIERLKNKMDDRDPLAPNQKAGYLFALEDVLSFLSTLESEKPMNQEELEEEINRTYHDGSVTDTSDLDHNSYENIARHFYEIGCRRTAEKYDEIEYNRQRAEEETTRNEFVEELDKYFFGCTSSITIVECYKVAEHFAKWGAEHLAEK